MNLKENAIGWETEDGQTVAYKEEFSILNCCRHPNFRIPVFAQEKEDEQ